MIKLLGGVFAFALAVPLAVAEPEPANSRGIRFDSYTRGGLLFQKHCAECHGALAQGAENWRQPGADGKLPPPPLNGTGHAWHHPRAALARVIRDGTQKIGGNMPAWGGTLSDAEIDSVIDWLVSKWPDPAYDAWRRGGHH